MHACAHAGVATSQSGKLVTGHNSRSTGVPGHITAQTTFSQPAAWAGVPVYGASGTLSEGLVVMLLLLTNQIFCYFVIVG